MMTITTMSTKQAIKDVGKAVGLPFSYVTELNKHVPHKCRTIDQAIEESHVIKRAAEDNEDWETDEWVLKVKELQRQEEQDIDKITFLKQMIAKHKNQLARCFEVAKKLEGIARQRSTHACAILISNKPVFGEIPLCWDTTKKKHITGFDMYDLEELGFLKLDILGLKTLDVIADCHPAGAKCLYDPEKHFGPFDDVDTYKLISSGHTKGVFQLESALGRQWCKRTRPIKQDEISDLVALIRPAVLEIGMANDYLKNRKDPNNITYIHQDLMGILSSTYGCQIYQEQMIEMVKRFAGWDLAKADALRKAVGKKIPEKLAAMKDDFKSGVKKTIGSAELADELWGWIEKGAEYGFNRSHSMCYGGFLAYITAWCKIHYPMQFFLSMLKFSKDEADPHEEINEIFYDAKLFKISITPPNIDDGNIDFELDEVNRQISFGLSHIKHIGSSSIKKMKELKDSAWQKLIFERNINGINAQVFNALILSGAFDKFSLTRKNMKGQFDFIEELTPREQQIFLQFNCGKEGLLVKETKKDGRMTYFVLACKTFKEAVYNFLTFLKTENQKMKIVNARRSDELIRICENCIIEYKDGQEFGSIEKAGYETYYLSVPVTCSEVDVYHDDRKTHHLVEVEREVNNVGIASIALINKVNKRIDKFGREMAFVGLQDRTYQLDAVMFNDAWRRFNKHINIGKVVLIEGRKRKGGLQIERVIPL
jgi:DNA polymerase-3 subunit alpha